MQVLQVVRVDVRRDVELARDELTCQRSDSCSQFQNSITEKRSKRVTHPEVELTCSLELRKNVRTISILVIQVVNQPETKHRQKRKDTAPRPDLLSFFLRAWQIADGHFEYPGPPLGKLEDYLDLESEVITAKRYRFQKRR